LPRRSDYFRAATVESGSSARPVNASARDSLCHLGARIRATLTLVNQRDAFPFGFSQRLMIPRSTRTVRWTIGFCRPPRREAAGRQRFSPERRPVPALVPSAPSARHPHGATVGCKPSQRPFPKTLRLCVSAVNFLFWFPPRGVRERSFVRPTSAAASSSR